MKAKMLNQLFQKGKETLTKYEKKAGKDLDRDMWSTVYITDIPIQTLTAEAISKIKKFTDTHLGNKEMRDFTVERNGMLGFWQFTVITFEEVIEFDIVEETDEERKARLMPIAEEWWEKEGQFDNDYADGGNDWRVEYIEESDDGNTLEIQMTCDGSWWWETLKKTDNGWKRERQEN